METSTPHPWNLARHLSSRLLGNEEIPTIAADVERWPFDTTEEVEHLIAEAEQTDDPHHTLSKSISSQLTQDGLKATLKTQHTDLKDWNVAQSFAGSVVNTDDIAALVADSEFETPAPSTLEELRDNNDREGHQLVQDIARTLRQWATERDANGDDTAPLTAPEKGESYSRQPSPTLPTSEPDRLAHQLVASYLGSGVEGFDPVAEVAEYLGIQPGKTELRLAVVNSKGGSQEAKQTAVAEKLREWRENPEEAFSRTMVRSGTMRR